MKAPGDQRGQYGQQHQSQAEGHIQQYVLPQYGQRLSGHHAAQGQDQRQVDDRLDCFFTMAVMVVTSSGREVPMATSVAPMMDSGTPKSRASAVP